MVNQALVHTTGLWKLSRFSLNFLRASFWVLAPLTTEGMPELPTYSRMVLSWSGVGGFSVMSSSNGCRRALVCAEWSLAWSSVAVSEALADACFSRLATRKEAGGAGLVKEGDYIEGFTLSERFH